MEITGTSTAELAEALSLMQDILQDGQSARLTLCSDWVPDESDLAEMYLNMVAVGNHVSYPTAAMVGDIPITQFNITKGSPALLAILPLIPIALITGLITFGIVKIETITKALLPIILVTVGGLIVLAAVLREPATKYIERGGKLPLLAHAKPRGLLVPSTIRDTEWVTIQSGGQTTFKYGEVASREAFDKENARVRKLGENPATGQVKDKDGKWKWVTDTYSPAVVRGEPLPPAYRDLLGFIDDPASFILATLPAVTPEEGERKIDAVIRQLKSGVEGIQDSDRFREFLGTMAKFHDYSIGNQILIMLQKPGATHVGGFNKWKDMNRWVKKGERGIAILAPIFAPKSKEEGEKAEAELEPGPVFFKVVYVFDVSQTEGKPLPEFDVPVLTGEGNEALFADMLAMAKNEGLTVTFESHGARDPDVKGYYSGKSIWVRPEESRAQQLKTLIHEVAHYFSENVFRIPRGDAETIAESAAYVVGAHFGFDTGTRSFPYVALWAKEKKVLSANMNAIRKVADTILHKVIKGETSNLAQTQPRPPLALIEKVRELWGKATAWEGIEANAMFVIFSDDNPHVQDYNDALAELWRFREFQTGQWKPALVKRKVDGDFFLPALKPFEPYEFANYVLVNNRFSEWQIPMYSGLSGKAPLRVPDHIWREVLAGIDGEFVKQGDVYVVKTPEVERPIYMRAAPTWRDIADARPAVTPKYFTTNPPSPKVFDGETYGIHMTFETRKEADQESRDLRDSGSWMKGDKFKIEPWEGGYVIYARWAGQPDTRSSDPVKADLEKSVKEEDQATSDYLKRGVNAINQGDPKTSELFQHVAAEEEQHAQEFEKRLRELPKGDTFVPDSAEYLAYTIEDIGYRDKLDEAFQTAIARAKGG